MKNKKGDLLTPETIKIIIAVVCIVFLVILSIQLFFMAKSKTRIEQAKANLADIDIKIKDLKEGQSVEYLLLSPVGYSLTSWPGIYSDGSRMPNECVNKKYTNCLCFCLTESLIDSYQMYQSCNEHSICISTDKPVLVTFDTWKGIKTANPLYLISVDELIKAKRSLRISLNNGEYKIEGS